MWKGVHGLKILPNILPELPGITRLLGGQRHRLLADASCRQRKTLNALLVLASMVFDGIH